MLRVIRRVTLWTNVITLPVLPRQAHLRAFWFALCLLVAVSAIICMRLVALSYSWTYAILLCVALTLVIGLAETDWIRPVYLGWNNVTQFVAGAARRSIMGICFAIIVLVSLAGARFCRRELTASGWEPRPTQAAPENLSPFAEPSTCFQSMSGLAAYLHWARRSNNLWAVILLPFLWALLLLAKDEDDTLPAYIYTLF
jgi:hypothetical protein